MTSVIRSDWICNHQTRIYTRKPGGSGGLGEGGEGRGGVGDGGDGVGGLGDGEGGGGGTATCHGFMGMK